MNTTGSPASNPKYWPLRLALWFLFSVFTFGLLNKYSKRLKYFEDLVPRGEKWTQDKKFSDRGDETSTLKTMRQKQQEEWDRLNITVSVITATSAAALAIQSMGPGGSQVYWLATAFYNAAFGMSLQGIIIITYVTIAAGSASDELIGRLAKGELFPGRFIWPVALMMSIPAIVTTYSAFALLAGLVVMITKRPQSGTATEDTVYLIISIAPIAATFVCLSFAYLFCEVGTWIEEERRNEAAHTVGNLPRVVHVPQENQQ